MIIDRWHILDQQSWNMNDSYCNIPLHFHTVNSVKILWIKNTFSIKFELELYIYIYGSDKFSSWSRDMKSTFHVLILQLSLYGTLLFKCFWGPSKKKKSIKIFKKRGAIHFFPLYWELFWTHLYFLFFTFTLNISYIYIYIYIYNWNSPGDLGSIPGRVIPKTLKMILDTSLLNTQQYKVCIKCKMEQFWERNSALPYTSVY